MSLCKGGYLASLLHRLPCGPTYRPLRLGRARSVVSGEMGVSSLIGICLSAHLHACVSAVVRFGSPQLESHGRTTLPYATPPTFLLPCLSSIFNARKIWRSPLSHTASTNSSPCSLQAQHYCCAAVILLVVLQSFCLCSLQSTAYQLLLYKFKVHHTCIQQIQQIDAVRLPAQDTDVILDPPL